MENNNIESVFPFIIIILAVVISNLKKKRAQKERERTQEKKASSLPPVYRAPSPPVQVPEVLTVTKEEKRMSSIPEEKIKVVRNRRPRIQKVVRRLRSKKDLILLAEILNPRCF